MSEEGKRREWAIIRETTHAALIPIRATIATALRAEQEFKERAPYMQRQADGLFRDVREQRGKDDPMAEVAQELRDAPRRDYLRSLPEADRGKLLRAIADDGTDLDGLLDTALRAPRFLGLVDVPTRKHVTDAHLRRQGLDVELARSTFAAARYQQLEAALEATLDALGVSPEREPPIRL